MNGDLTLGIVLGAGGGAVTSLVVGMTVYNATTTVADRKG